MRVLRARAAHRIVGFASLAVVASAGDVIVVDATGGGNFTSIRNATYAAAPGDTILVRTGTYRGFETNRGIAVVADAGANVQILGRVKFHHLPPDQTGLLVGVHVVADRTLVDLYGSVIDVWDAEGAVRIEDCTIDGDFQPFTCVSGVTCVSVTRSRDVALARCVLTPGRGWSPIGSHYDYEVAVYDCELNASDPCDTSGSCYGVDGGHGASLCGSSSIFFASGSRFEAGNGSRSLSPNLGCFCGSTGGYGGDGIHQCNNTPSDLFLLDCTVLPGQGGAGVDFGCGGGAPGGNGVPIHGPATLYSGASRGLETMNPARESSTAVLEIRGEPGDDTYLFTSGATKFRFVPHYRGVQLTKQPGPPVHLGTIPASGTMTASLPLPSLDPGEASRRIYLQAAHRTPSGEWTLGSPVSLIVLSSLF